MISRASITAAGDRLQRQNADNKDIKYIKEGRFGYPKRPSYGSHESVCKPGSVFDSHLSGTRVAARLKPPCGNGPGKPICPHCGVAPDRVYRGRRFPGGPVSSYLAFPPLPRKTRRYISVALFLKSPSADVIRYPALWSPDFPHKRPFGAAYAAVWPARRIIIPYKNRIRQLSLVFDILA